MTLKNLVFNIATIAYFITNSAIAQVETVIPSMRGMYQSALMNPAFIPQHRIQIGLPVLNNIGADMNLVGLNLNDVIASKDDSGYLDMDQLASRIDGDRFGLRMAYVTDYIYVSFPITHGFYMSMGVQANNQANFTLSSNLLKADLLNPGSTVEFDGIGLQLLAYTSMHVGLAKSINDKWTVGVRGKYLIGHMYAGIEDLDLKVSSGSEIPYPVSLSATGTIVTSGIPVLTNELNGKRVSEEQQSFSDINNLAFPTNRGMAFDMGATYQWNKQLSVFASIADIGFIRWKSQAYQYRLNTININYDGLDYDLVNAPERRAEYFDSLLALIDKAETVEQSFTRWLPTRYMAGANYQLSRNNTFGFLFQLQQLPTFATFATTLSYTRTFGRILRLHANYSLINNGRSLLGIGAEMKLGPVQLFLIQNNALLWFDPAQARYLNFRLGVSLVFGQTEYYKKQQQAWSESN